MKTNTLRKSEPIIKTKDIDINFDNPSQLPISRSPRVYKKYFFNFIYLEN